LSIFEPEGLWDAVAERLQRPGAMAWLLLVPVVGGLAVGAAAELGVRIFNAEWNPVFGYSARPDREGARLRLLWGALALAPFVQAAAGIAILPFYRAPRRWAAALAVAVIGTIPLYVAGMALIVLPGIIIVLGAFFVSFVWWSIGACQLLQVPAGEGAEFVTVTVLASSSMLFLCSTAFPF
jgi:hypothetical protein